jgi:DNA primase catalytic core
VTATLHKLSAGDGYTYLTRQVAAGDSTERGYRSLGDYYSAKGEAPGVWAGRGLDISGQVTGAQMLNLFGQGLHPDADRIRHEAATSGVGVAAADAATRLGQPFPTFEPNQQWRDRLSDAYAAFNTVRGNAVNKPIPAEERERIRTDAAQAMFAESSGRDPRTASELTSFVAQASRPDRTAVAGYDVTFSPVKSVSTLWAVAPREILEQVEAAHAAAVAETIGWLERNVGYTRIGAHGVAQVDVKGLIAATFTHRDSRAGDPDLHTHVAISNKVQTLDGRWLALDGRMIHRYLVAASEHYNTRLEAEIIQRVGGRFVERAAAPGKRPIRELADVDSGLNEAFSCRRRDITAHRTELVEAFRQRNGRLPTSVEMIALAQQANLATRQAKHEPRSLAEQREQWREQAIEVLGSAESLREMVQRAITPRTAAPAELSPAELSRMAFDTVRAVEAGRAQWARHNVVAEAQRQLRYAGHAIGADTDLAAEQVTAVALGPEHSIRIGTDPEPAGAAAPAALTRLDGSSVYRMAGGQLHTSPSILDAERAVVAAAGQGGARTVSPGDVEIALLEWSANNGGRTLNTSQAAMVHAVATSGRRLQLALAPAGTGKTTTMGALATVWRSNGGDLVALAPQASAAQELAAQIPGVTSDTVDKLVHDLHGGPGADPQRWQRDVTERTLIIVDEAGLASTPNLSAVVGFARQQGARVLLVGDDRQRGAAGAGGVLRDVEATHGSLALDEVLRFRDLQQGAASLAMRAGDIGAVGYYLDRDLLHTVAPDEAAAAVFSAWHADQQSGTQSVMIAPTLELVTELNLRARAARLAASTERVGRELALPNGETVSAGDLVVTKKNARWLSIGGTDFVRNNNRWTVEQVHRDGSVTATEITRGVTRTLPADYLTDGYVRLGYAATTAGVQGLTVEGSAYALLTPDMTRNELYPAMTRGKGHNHGFIITGGVGDAHEVITPEAISPQTRAEMFAAIIQRDGSDRSALTQLRESADPVLRLAPAAFAYEHAILTGAETLIGPQKLAALTAAAEQAVPGITNARAWDTMRGHLATITMQGRDAIAGLRSAARDRDLDSPRDLAAVLDWRLDHSGNHSLGEGPLPWLPAIPTALATNPEWGNYLSARERLVYDLADQVHAAAGSWTVQSAPAWATPYLASGGLTQQLAIWRAAQGVLDADLRPAGPRPQRIAHIKLHSELTRAAAVVAGDPADGTGRWSQALSAAGAQQVTTDPYWPVLISRLTMADTAGLPVDRLIAAALGEKPLPSEAPAATLWTRLAPHIGAPTTAVTTHALRPAWIADLATVLGTQTAERIAADRLWPAIVTHVDVAARAGRDPAALVTDAAGMLAAVQDSTAGHQHPVVLLTNITALTDPEPLAEGEALPADPTEADLLAPADAFTTVDTAAPAVDEIPAPDEPAGPEQLVPDQPIDSTDDGPAVGDRRLLDVLAAAHDYYRQQVPGSWVPDYLDGRGLSVLTDRAGLAPAGWTSAVDHLRGAGYADPEILAAGLARTSSRGTLIDAFRDRVMLPIHHTDGQVVGFTGRRNPATVDDYNPKYLNSPITAVYRKTDQPYGLTPQTIAALRAGADLAIVEGPMDAEAINLAAAGRVVAVAPLGTALTAGQLRTLNKVAPLADRQVLTVMDNDQAGRAASVRAFHLLADTGIPDPQAVTLPAGRNDPAETLARDGAARLDAALINDTHPLADTVVDDILDRWPAPTSPEYQIGALNEVAPVVAALPAQRRQEQATRVADRLTLDSVTVIDAVIEHLPAPPIDPRSTLGLPERPVLLTEQQQQPARPLAGVATEDLRTRTQDWAAELAGARAAAAENSARIELLASGRLVRSEQNRQHDVLARADAITAYRADRDLLGRLRPEWNDRAAAITASEARIANSGRRAARQETERLAELRQQQDTAAQQIPAAAARVRELQPLVGDTEQQDRALAAAAQIHQNGRALLAATEDRQQAELLNRRAATPALDQTAADAERDLAQLAEELATRPETAHELARTSSVADRLLGPSLDIEADITRPGPDLDREIER